MKARSWPHPLAHPLGSPQGGAARSNRAWQDPGDGTVSHHAVGQDMQAPPHAHARRGGEGFFGAESTTSGTTAFSSRPRSPLVVARRVQRTSWVNARSAPARHRRRAGQAGRRRNGDIGRRSRDRGRALVRSRAEEAETLRRLPDEVVIALRDAGLLRMCVPTKYGGPEIDPLTMMTAIEVVAAADGAAGWCTMIASTTSSMASYLPENWAEKIYEDATVITGGAFAPSGTGTAVDGGHRVNGRWAWGSGTQHCQWITGGSHRSRRVPLMFFPRPTSRSLKPGIPTAARGTGSNDFEVHDAFVPDGCRCSHSWAAARAVRRSAGSPLLAAWRAGWPPPWWASPRTRARSRGVAAEKDADDGARRSWPRFAMASRLWPSEAALGSARAFPTMRSGWRGTWCRRATRCRCPRARIRLACAHAGADRARRSDLAYTPAGPRPSTRRVCWGAAFATSTPPRKHHGFARMLETFGKLRLGIDVDTAML